MTPTQDEKLEAAGALRVRQTRRIPPVRIAGALAAYRIASDSANLETLHSSVPTMDEVEAAVTLVQTLTHHASLLALAFASDPAAKLESEERRHLFDTLPDNFATAEAQSIGSAMEMNERKVERALSAMIEAGLITRESPGILPEARYRQ